MDYNYQRLYMMTEDNIEELPETTAAEQNISRLLNDLKAKDPELFFQMDSAIGRLARAYEKQGFFGGIEAAAPKTIVA